MAERDGVSASRWAGLLLGVAAAAAVLSAVGAVLAAVWALPQPAAQAQGHGSLPPLRDQRVDAANLGRALAGRRLLEPAEINAAVKDSGTAQDLLTRLRLQGTVQLGGQPVAYVMVEDQGVKVVRAGERLLDFEVEKVEAGRVELSLQGVRVTLSY
jgi:hypothetical protein